jgi:hypothetical protein
MTSLDRPRLAVRSPARPDRRVPYLLGFHPADSGGWWRCAVGGSSSPRQACRRADRGHPALPRRDLPAAAEAATVIRYGPAVRSPRPWTRPRSGAAGLIVLDALRVADGRYWSYLHEPGCCPPEGTPYDPLASEVTATAVFSGQVALPDRAALTAQVAPLDGPARAAMRQATARAEHRLAELLGAAGAGGPPVAVSRRDAVEASADRELRAAGEVALRGALRRSRRGGRLTDDEVAWLGLLLDHLPVRDRAWERTDGRDEDLALWTDVLRRVGDDLAPAPASLLAFVAWRVGQGALAAVALERALAARPDYPLALLMDDLLRRGVPPSELDGWPAIDTPGVVRRRKRRRGAR